ncbi:hypothetical protein GCM10020227_25570 [Streptomyces flavovirens]
MRDAVRDLLGEVSAPSVPGAHYAHNAVAALAAGVALGIPAHNLASALGSYTGVKRRLQLRGEAAGVQVIDSYAGLLVGARIQLSPVLVGPSLLVTLRVLRWLSVSGRSGSSASGSCPAPASCARSAGRSP